MSQKSLTQLNNVMLCDGKTTKQIKKLHLVQHNGDLNLVTSRDDN